MSRFKTTLAVLLVSAVAACGGSVIDEGGSVAGKADSPEKVKGQIGNHYYNTDGTYIESEAMQDWDGPDAVIWAEGDIEWGVGIGYLPFLVRWGDATYQKKQFGIRVVAGIIGELDASEYTLSCLKFYNKKDYWAFTANLADAIEGVEITPDNERRDAPGFFAKGIASHGISGTYKCVAVANDGSTTDELGDSYYGDWRVYLETVVFDNFKANDLAKAPPAPQEQAPDPSPLQRDLSRQADDWTTQGMQQWYEVPDVTQGPEQRQDREQR